MKRILFVTLLTISFVINLQAQADSLKPVKGNWGFSLVVSGLVNDIDVLNLQDPNGNVFLFARHYLKDDQVIRLGLGLNYINQNWFNADSISIASGNRALQEVDSTTSRFDFSLSVGIEKHVGETKRLDPYFGGELVLGRIGNTKTNTDIDITDVTGTSKRQIISQNDGGFHFELGAIVGANFFFSKNLSLGVEFGYSFVFDRTGGDYSTSDVTTPVNGAQITSFESGKAESSKTSIGGSKTGGILLSFFF